MEFYEWSDRLSVKIPSIDRQHKVLIGIINELHQVLEKNKETSSSMRAILGKLRNYTRIHFIYEELIFKRLDYPEIEQHFAAHKNLVDNVELLYEKVKIGEMVLPENLMDFLKNWLNHHILEEDMAYSTFLIENGIK